MTDKAKERERSRRHYQANKEKYAARNRAYYQMRKEWFQRYGREWRRKKGSGYNKNRILKSKFGITLAQFQAMSTAQNNVCAICKLPEWKPGRWGKMSLAVDHCHATNTVRGLLCNRCNQAIGQFNDDPELLEAAVIYLRRAKLSQAS